MIKTKINLRAFTLIELLIVIAIITILASIVITNVNAAKQKSRNSTALANLQAVSTLAQRCLLEGSNINVPASQTANPGNAICPLYADTYPDLTSTRFIYHSDAFQSNYSTDQFAFTANSIDSSAKIVCGSNLLLANWYGLSWDLRNMVGCKTSGF